MVYIVWLLLSLICLNKATETPIIGILAQEKYIVARDLAEIYQSYIAASYVKYLESAGARVIPVWIGQDDEYYERVVNYTNGVFFPGGGTYFNETKGYGEAAKNIYKLAVEANKKGIYYPIWGTCLGMQALAFADAGKDIRVAGVKKRAALPLDFVDDYKSSRLFSKAAGDIIQILESQNVTYNQHKYSLTEEVLEENNISSHWKITTTNKDDSSKTFISSMEHLQYPIYGVQFHPEKNCFEFKKGVGIPHSSEAIIASQYFSNFFVNECRKNDNSFPDSETETKSLIYNYSPLFTGKHNSSYEQIYAFQESDYENVQLTM